MTVKSVETEEDKGRWNNLTRGIGKLGNKLRIGTETNEDQTAKYLRERGIMSQRHYQTFDTEGGKVRRISSYYSEELKYGNYTIRVKPSLGPNDHLHNLTMDLNVELGNLLNRNRLYDRNLTNLRPNQHTVAGYIELTVHNSKGGAFDKVVQIMNLYMEECIKKYEGIRK